MIRLWTITPTYLPAHLPVRKEEVPSSLQLTSTVTGLDFVKKVNLLSLPTKSKPGKLEVNCTVTFPFKKYLCECSMPLSYILNEMKRLKNKLMPRSHWSVLCSKLLGFE